MSQCRAYKLWHAMKARVRSHKSYTDVEICQDWEVFENFKTWCEDQEGFYRVDTSGRFYCLDKDILGNGKEYSPDSCTFVPTQLNNLFRSSWSEGLSGVQVLPKQKKPYRSYINFDGKHIHLGYFHTEDEAYQAHLVEREKYLKNFLGRYSGKIDERVVAKISQSW